MRVGKTFDVERVPVLIRLWRRFRHVGHGEDDALDARVLRRMDDAADAPDTVCHVRLVGGSD